MLLASGVCYASCVAILGIRNVNSNFLYFAAVLIIVQQCERIIDCLERNTQNVIFDDFNRTAHREVRVLNRYAASLNVLNPNRAGIVGRDRVFMLIKSTSVNNDIVRGRTAVLNPKAIDYTIFERQTIHFMPFDH